MEGDGLGIQIGFGLWRTMENGKWKMENGMGGNGDEEQKMRENDQKMDVEKTIEREVGWMELELD